MTRSSVTQFPLEPSKSLCEFFPYFKLSEYKERQRRTEEEKKERERLDCPQVGLEKVVTCVQGTRCACISFTKLAEDACVMLVALVVCLLLFLILIRLKVAPSWHDRGKGPDQVYCNGYFTLTVTPGEPFLRVNGRRIEEPRVPLTEKANRSSTSTSTSSSSASSSSSSSLSSSSSSNQVIRVGPFEEGSTVAIECSTSGGRPLPEVKWYNGSNLLRSKISVTANPDLGSVVTATTRFIVSRFELNSVFTCEVMNNATSHPLSKTVLFDVHGECQMTLSVLFLSLFLTFSSSLTSTSTLLTLKLTPCLSPFLCPVLLLSYPLSPSLFPLTATQSNH